MRLVVIESPCMPQQRAVESLISMPSSDASRIAGRVLDAAGLTDWQIFRDNSTRADEVREFAHRIIRARNTYYARAAMLDSLLRGEAPFLSHLLYTQVLDDDVPDERKHGMAAGLAISKALIEASTDRNPHVFYTDLGVSDGMLRAAWKLGGGYGDFADHVTEIEGDVRADGRHLGTEARRWYLDRVSGVLAWLGEGAAS